MSSLMVKMGHHVKSFKIFMENVKNLHVGPEEELRSCLPVH